MVDIDSIAWFDEGGDYPSDAALDLIQQWPYQEAAACLDFVKTIWHWPDFARHDLTPAEREIVHAHNGDKYLRLATGGWSGNESIVSALRANRMISALCWQLNALGGLHIFRYPRD